MALYTNGRKVKLYIYRKEENVLPEGYIQLDYLEATGTQYINTGYATQIGDAYTLKNVSRSDEISQGAVFSAGVGTYQLILLFYTRKETQYFKYFNTGSALGIAYDFSSFHTVQVSPNGQLLYNDIIVGVAPPTAIIDGENSLHLFRRQNGADLLKGTIGRTTITNKGVTKLDLVPCLDDKSVAGMYDLVAQQMHYNAGTGTFQYVSPFDYTPVEYLESTGAQFIYTNIFPDNTYTFDTKISVSDDNYNCIYWGVRSEGTYSSNNSQCYLNSNPSSLSGGYLRLITTATTNPDNWNSGVIPQKDVAYDFTGITTVSTMKKMIFPLILFGLNDKGTVNTSVGRCRIYKFVARSNGKVVADLIPVLDKYSRPCMYDKVSGKFLYNQGEGEFLYKRLGE